MGTYTVNEVADMLLALAYEGKVEISNLKLQKLIYYAQAWSLVFYDKPLFSEDFQAWIHGPVLPSLFHRFKHLRWSEITEKVHPKEDSELRLHLEKIIQSYGEATATQLERLSHSERPWREARGTLAADESSKVVVTKESMKSFYSELLHATE